MMNYFILFLTILNFSTFSWAQNNGTATEGNTNQILLNNATTSQQYMNSQNNQPVHINILSDKGSSTTTSATNLTDQEKQLSENFVHQGMANQIIKEKCVGEMKEACAGQTPDHKVMGMNPGLIKAATMAYATMGAMAGDGLLSLEKGTGKAFNGAADKPAAATDAATKPTDAAAKPDAATKKEATDYCKFIPTATEMIASFSQKNTVDAMNSGETSQKEALLKAAKSHEGRAEQANIQSYGWYGGAACYVISYSTGTFAFNTSLAVKTVAAGFLGMFYTEEAAANTDYANKTKAIAEALPGKGQCNPITENECYCSQPDTQNDPQYCKRQIETRSGKNSAFTRLACTNDRMQVDPTCSCQKTNTCFDKFMENQGAANLEIGMAYGNSPFKPLASLAHGKLENGIINGTAQANLSAIAKKGLNEFASKIKDNSFLTPAQKEVADAIASKGFPSAAARLMALNQPSQAAMDAAKGKLNGTGASYQFASYSPSSKNSVLDFSGGNGLGLGGKKEGKKDDVADLLGKLKPGAKGATNNTKVLEFAEKAQAKASQITASDRPIFEIISQRYQVSGRRLLQIDASN